MITDDLPWPELGNVSRGATRGNQGAKGSLGPPDTEGRRILQLRVQPGVLAVKLNTRSSEWYALLDSRVQDALKRTKTFWRKARRRQDYDPQADQDHMELHEWLQQLKDKAMNHLELLMQRGEIKGPPYVMPDHLEFAFMRGFIEREASNVHHNPRLRGLPRNLNPQHLTSSSADELTTESDDEGADPISVDTSAPPTSPSSWSHATDSIPASSPLSVLSAARPSMSHPTWPKYPPGTGTSPFPSDFPSAFRNIETANQALRVARDRLIQTKSASADAFSRYLKAREAEQAAEREIRGLEEQLDELVRHAFRLHQNQAPGGPSCSNSSIQGTIPSESPSPGLSHSFLSAVETHQNQRSHQASPHALRNSVGELSGSLNAATTTALLSNSAQAYAEWTNQHDMARLHDHSPHRQAQQQNRNPNTHTQAHAPSTPQQIGTRLSSVSPVVTNAGPGPIRSGGLSMKHREWESQQQHAFPSSLHHPSHHPRHSQSQQHGEQVLRSLGASHHSQSALTHAHTPSPNQSQHAQQHSQPLGQQRQLDSLDLELDVQ